MLQGIVLSVRVCVHVYSRYLVNDVIPKVLGCQDKHTVEDVSGLFNQLLPPAVVVVLSLQPGNLWGIVYEWSGEWGCVSTVYTKNQRVPKSTERRNRQATLD